MLPQLVLACLMGLVFTTETPSQKLATFNGEFALQLYNKVRPSVAGSNIFFSPVSISSAFAMVYAGAKSDTRIQMEKTLKFESIQGSIHSSFKELIDAFNDPSNNFTLDFANRLFGRNDFEFLPTFLHDTDKFYGAELERLPFKTAAEQSRVHINEWVANNTQQKIKNLLPAGSVNSMTALVLVNAVYFKGLWLTPFESANTKKGQFKLNSQSQIELDMMHLSDSHFRYGESTSLDCKVLELPYTGEQVSMYILLPNQVEGLARLEDSLNMESLNTALTTGLNKVKVKVTIPKFKLTQDISLKPVLSAMGMEDLFVADKADLSGINGAEDLYVTSAFHKAYIEVNEEGTEAAAATGVIIGLTSVQNPLTFTADHPFLFLIREKPTGSILFLGRLADSPDKTQRIYSLKDGTGDGDGNTAASIVQSSALLCSSLGLTLGVSLMKYLAQV